MLVQGAPLAYTPFCDNSKDMDGFRVWKQGFWKEHLRGRPYHISALYVVDLARFRCASHGLPVICMQHLFLGHSAFLAGYTTFKARFMCPQYATPRPPVICMRHLLSGCTAWQDTQPCWRASGALCMPLAASIVYLHHLYSEVTAFLA